MRHIKYYNVINNNRRVIPENENRVVRNMTLYIIQKKKYYNVLSWYHRNTVCITVIGVTREMGKKNTK